jgi:tRNA G18 (ribose-2'-O)-methylase SpoU
MLIYGTHAGRSAVINSPDTVRRAYVCGRGAPSWLSEFLHPSKIVYIDDSKIKGMLPKNAVHQGIVLEVDDVSTAISQN